MRKIVGAEITRIESAAEETFFDECTINHVSGYVYSGVKNIPVIQTTSGIECGYQTVNGNTNYRGEIIVSEVDAKVRLAKDTTITVLDTLTLTKKNGVVTNLPYTVDAVLPGMSCIVVNLKKLAT